MVQIRLSTLATSIGVFLSSLIAAGISRFKSFKSGAYRIQLPSSQLDWSVLAVEEHAQHHPLMSTRGPDGRRISPAKFAIRNEGISFIVTENLDYRIVAPAAFYDQKTHPMTPGSTTNDHLKFVQCDPWAGYSQSPTQLGYGYPATP